MKIQDHRLYVEGKAVSFKKSPNTSGKFSSEDLDTIIIHYTAGANASSSIDTLTNKSVKASAHLVVSRDGSITQLVPFDEVAWHAGKSEYNGRKGFNKYSIGIEIDNAGLLTKAGNSYKSWFGREYAKSGVVEAIHRNETTKKYWHAYTEAQIEAVESICKALIDTYGIQSILGHEEVAPMRKVDPGPAFPLDQLREKILFGRQEDEEDVSKESNEGVVTASKLNIREMPDGNAEKVTNALPKNISVKILEEKHGWYKVAVEIEGWVAAKYVKNV